MSLEEVERAFADRLRSWLTDNLDPHWRDGCDTWDKLIQAQIDWESKLAEGRWTGAWWPKESGGLGLSAGQKAIFAELTAEFDAPYGIGRFGRRLLGPAVMRFGTEAQRATILPQILNATHVWCQGYSEPNAGSDLASVRTSAQRVGDSYVVNGSKIWTTDAQYADSCFVLVRTDAEVAKHAGLSILLVDLRTPGVEIRPINDVNGNPRFCEVFYTDVRVPAEGLLGEEGQGWEIARYILTHERGAVMVLDTLVRIERFVRDFAAVLGAEDDPALLAELGRGAAKLAASRALAYRTLGDQLAGADPSAGGSIVKLYWSRAWLEMADAALVALQHQAFTDPAVGSTAAILDGFWDARSQTIAAGATEIQRDIIAKRILGLPGYK